ncbi:hypothetical protein EAX61_03205 [Dokdonia sinensis]|uniref:DUF304 domain-containing protein n=1 Tax=Dokdonia sinensis TaxID=2479847 RepID=A0A3M0GL71_9FLAO|nr:hypothetical protein [Dokdonia sinensis]RMB63412.1 hypothetical protein EAX61_03205 [Dokdonia sinensis]
MDRPVIIFQKRSEPSVGEALLLNSSGILPFLITHLRNKKFDSIIFSKNTVRLKLKNKIVFDKTFVHIKSIDYDSIKESLKINADGKISQLSLKAFRITYDEAKRLKGEIDNFNRSLR